MKPGDIVRNDWTIDSPAKYTMYLKRGRVGKYATFDCLTFDGRIIHHSVDHNRLVVVGHIDEYDALKKALLQLKEIDYNETQGSTTHAG